MQLLIVHRDAEVGEQLVEMVKGHTEHDCGFVNSVSAALNWARCATHCSLLITQLRDEGVDGLTLGGTLSEMFAGLQTMFLPDYPAAEQRLELAQSKVFPEPIDGELLLEAIALVEAQRQVGQDLYHSLDVLQMLCLARRSGAVQLVKGFESAVVFLEGGNIVHAERGATHGQEALSEIVSWKAVEFAYDQYVRAPAASVRMPWHEAIASAISDRKTQVAETSKEPEIFAQTGPAAKGSRWGLFGKVRKPG